ncbi:MAG: phospholipase D family protein [Lachnospiraceae bacterium]|nr:phospholipase D family protein [Lachnospiraceae bacterium]
MSILNQPFQGQLGNVLIDKIENSNYNQITIFSAFAKNSGVLRLKSSLKKFKQANGKITAFIGIDLDGTSYEALLNLYSLCDSLYVIHSENMSTTYHSKIYLLENASSAWCAIGSNNFTGGGLWTNFESASIQEYSLPEQHNELENIYSIIAKYSDSDYVCSTKINSIDDINTLLDSNYISKEVSQKITTIKRRTSEKANQKKNHLFGSEKVSIPTIITTQKSRKPLSQDKKTIQPNVDYIVNTPPTTPAFTNEQFWFEMRKSTGGSRNILDLSKLGQIVEGSVAGTPYEYTDPNRMYGGVKFFEIDPEDTSHEKNITINYLGKDYFPSTIKFAPDNGSWRIQLKGEPTDGTNELSKFGNRGDFVFKILVFEKITPDYYVLSLLDDSELDNIKSLSRVWGRNGSGATSKAYGML